MDQVKNFFFGVSAVRREEYWQPRADVYRARWGWLLKFELPGVRAEDLAVGVSGCRVTVTGVRRDTIFELEPRCVCYALEISYSRFERTIHLPCGVDNAKSSMDYRDGILIVRLITEEETP